ncbi:zinc finger MYM-type protein 6-like [Centruroides sculpturatus]|uniref:zinc finger MYM-type protein 6-like n=1 Tax=Centruroides sculpturatus TaxID=218467 RepID=UPI000C6D974F|nr:zinc finger MYM-type protein 6-like [Centruroides sculpturatus]
MTAWESMEENRRNLETLMARLKLEESGLNRERLRKTMDKLENLQCNSRYSKKGTGKAQKGTEEELQLQTNRLYDFEYEKLIKLSSDLGFKTLFESMPITQFWIKVKSEYPVLHKKAVRMLLPFSTTYLCESTFSAMVMIKLKQRNRYSVSSASRLAVTTLTPRIDDLTSKKEKQRSH